jgi:hypothetical protein
MSVLDFQSDKYREYDAVSRFERDEGLIVIPLAKLPSDPPPHYRVVRIHAPVGRRTVEVIATKTGTPPVMPGYGPTRSGDTMLSAEIEQKMPTDANGDGSRGHRTAGIYNYVQSLNKSDGTVDYRARNTATDAFQTVKPPFFRTAVDALAGILAQLIGFIPFFGPSIAQALLQLGGTDVIYDALRDKPPVGDVTNPNYVDLSVDTRPVYFTDNIIR